MPKPTIHMFFSTVGDVSGPKLLAKIGEMGYPVEYHKQANGPYEYNRDDLNINWGARCPDANNNRGTWINRNVFFDKYRQGMLLADAGVPTVELTRHRPARMDGWYSRSFEHHDGKDLEAGLDYGHYYSRHVDTTDEYRVHVFQDQVLRISRKVPVDRRANPVIRTGKYWGFSEHDYTLDMDARFKKACVEAVAALRYDFGGLDVGMTPQGRPVVFEVNSCPWLGGDAINKYARKIVALV